MSRVARVLSAERVNGDEGEGVDVKVDPGGGDTTVVPHFADLGDDSLPLSTDYAALADSSGMGAEHITGYADVQNEGKAKPGEKRIYARRPDGSVACDVWLKGDESIAITFGAGGSLACKPNGDVVINGVTISKSGAVSAPGEVTAKSSTTPIALSAHVHGSAAPGSPTTAPIFPMPPGP